MGIYDREYYRGETQGSGWLSGAAPACKAIIFINVVAFFAEGQADPTLFRDWFQASVDGIFGHGRVWQLLTATFLHASPFHLLFNMLLLWIMGREMEAMYGTRDFVALYLSAAVLSTLGWALAARSSHDPATMLGASGAVWAIVVLYVLYYPHHQILVFFVIPMEMWMMAVLFLGMDAWSLFTGQTQTTAVAAHLTGAAYGYAYKRFDLRFSRLGLGWRRFRAPRLRVVMPEPRERQAPRSAPGPTWSSPNPASAAKPATTAVIPEEQLNAKLDEVLAKIAREGRGGLTDEENRVLQEASEARPQPEERPPLMPTTRVRDARASDHTTLLEFNARLAGETEGKELDRAVLSRGIASALDDPDRLRYWVAEDETLGLVIGQAAVTREWSDWRNGWIWWFQSVYVPSEHRRRGVFRALYQHIRATARTAPDVIGLRLYVEVANSRAQETYQALGMVPGGYHVFEELWTERFKPRPG